MSQHDERDDTHANAGDVTADALTISRGGLASGVAPGPLSDAEQNAFFSRPLLARLATVRADGAPYIVPLWFERNERDGTFWFVIRAKARFMPDVVRDMKNLGVNTAGLES